MQVGRWMLSGILIGFAAFVAAGCDRQVHLGGIGDGGASLLWTATFEPGISRNRLADGNGGTYLENASVAASVTLDVAHRGQYAGRATVTPSMGMASLNYLYRVQPSPREAYYSAWFYIPSSFTVQSWLSLIHFRCSQTGDGNNLMGVWDLNVYPRADGSLVAHLYDYLTQTNHEQAIPTPVPVDSWVHFEVFFRKASDATGRIALWQDGTLIVDAANVVTTQTDWVQWDAGGASNDVQPPLALVYVDDAAISLTRLGPGQ